MRIRVIFDLFCKIKFKKKNGGGGFTHKTQTRVHVLSALAERVPCSAPTTSTKSGQADGSNECKNNSIVNLCDLYL